MSSTELVKKEAIELVSEGTQTVEDLIKCLIKLPKNFTLHPTGMQCGVAVDYNSKCVYLDDYNWLKDYICEVKEEFEEIGEPWIKECQRDKLVSCLESGVLEELKKED